MSMLPSSRTFPVLCLLTAMGFTMAVSADDDAPPARKRYDPNIELPQSEGRELILRACTMCHELGGLAGYKGYWGLPQWKEMVTDMVKHGAVLSSAEQEIAATYLARHFGLDASN
jgi:hypothetical protein